MSDPTLETNSVLLRAMKSDKKSDSWFEFRDLYEPLIRRWLNRSGLQVQDIDDLTQNVLTVVVRRLNEFEHQKRTGCFRAWLKSICTNCLRDFWRAKKAGDQRGMGKTCQEVIDQLEDDESPLSREWNREHDHHVVNKLLEEVRPGFEPETFRVFVETFMKGRCNLEVAGEFDMTYNAVSIAKSRVLASLRNACEGMVNLDEFI